MKKTTTFIFLGLLVLALLPFALAQENETQGDTYENETILNMNESEEVNNSTDDVEFEESENESEDETEIEYEDDVEEEEEISDDVEESENESEDLNEILSFNNQNGALVRMQQLELNIERNIVAGQKVLETLIAEEKNVTALEEILTQLEELKEQVKNYELSEDKKINVENFLAFKHDAITLSKEFRDEARRLVNPSQLKKVQEKIREHTEKAEELKQKAQKIRENIQKHNEEVTEKALNKYGVVDEELINKIRNQEIDPKQIREQVAERVNKMQEDKKAEVIQKMKEENARLRIENRQNYEQKIAQTKAQQQNRMEERIKNMDSESENTNRTMNEIQNRIPGNRGGSN